MQLLSLIPILILLLYLLVSIDLEYTGLIRVGLLEGGSCALIWKIYSSRNRQNADIKVKFLVISVIADAEITRNFSTYK